MHSSIHPLLNQQQPVSIAKMNFIEYSGSLRWSKGKLIKERGSLFLTVMLLDTCFKCRGIIHDDSCRQKKPAPTGEDKGPQLIQNAASQVLTGTKKMDHITPVLAALLWLPVKSRFDFKILALTYKALNGQGPSYLQDLLISYCPSRALRSQSPEACTTKLDFRLAG